MADVLNATPDQTKALRAMLAEFQRSAAAANKAIVARYLWWDTIRQEVARIGLARLMGFAGSFPPDLIKQNNELDASAQIWARIMVGLEQGEAECIGNTEGNQLVLGTVLRGSVPRPMEAFPFVALVVVAGAVGAWLIFNNLSAASRAESEAKLVMAETRKAAIAACTALAQNDPDLAKICFDTIAKADAAAAQQAAGPVSQVINSLAQGVGALSNLATSVAGTGGALARSASKASDVLLWLAILWAVSKGAKQWV